MTEDGSPHGPQRFVLWNPPLTRQAEASARSGNLHLSRTEGRARGGRGRSRCRLAWGPLALYTCRLLESLVVVPLLIS